MKDVRSTLQNMRSTIFALRIYSEKREISESIGKEENITGEVRAAAVNLDGLSVSA